MTPEDARTLAEDLLKTQDMRGYKAVFAEAREHERWPNEFSVIFDLYSKSGNLTDGPMVVIVDKTTRKARFFESL